MPRTRFLFIFFLFIFIFTVSRTRPDEDIFLKEEEKKREREIEREGKRQEIPDDRCRTSEWYTVIRQGIRDRTYLERTADSRQLDR